MVRERYRPRRCENCRADIAGQDDTCRRCGAGWAVRATNPSDDGGSLRERTAHVLDTRARRRAARAHRDRHTGADRMTTEPLQTRAAR
jgi:hypothetical protein